MSVNDLEGNDTSGEAIKVILQSKCGSYKRERVEVILTLNIESTFSLILSSELGLFGSVLFFSLPCLLPSEPGNSFPANS